jgi:hypothetical protein
MGTAKKCDCCSGKTMMVTHPEKGELEIRRRTGGVHHQLKLTIHEVVRALDPKGTSYVPATGTA